jgi:hypothetical protein
MNRQSQQSKALDWMPIVALAATLLGVVVLTVAAG